MARHEVRAYSRDGRETGFLKVKFREVYPGLKFDEYLMTREQIQGEDFMAGKHSSAEALTDKQTPLSWDAARSQEPEPFLL